MSSLREAKPVIIICTRDRALSLPFYRDVLDLPLVGEDPYAAVFGLKGATLRLSTVEGWTPHAHTVFGFEVADIGVACRALTTSGVKILIYPGFGQDENGVWASPDGATKVAWFNDPEGNNLSLTQFGST